MASLDIFGWAEKVREPETDWLTMIRKLPLCNCFFPSTTRKITYRPGWRRDFYVGLESEIMPSSTPRRHRSPLFSGQALAICAALAFGSPVSADLIKLNSGGELRGKIVKGRTNHESVTLETLSGVTVTVQRSDLVFLTMRPLNVEEYESRIRKLPNTLDAHWELADWCRKKSLVKQRETHLRHVIQLDPAHEPAHLALGHIRQKDGWVSKDELMTSQGYVKHKGKYITSQEFELIGKTEAERHEERAWFSKVRLWSGWVEGTLTSGAEKQRNGWQALEGISDPNATPAVMRFLAPNENRELRSLAVKILSHVGGNKPVPGLVQFSLSDVDPEVRYQALYGIGNDQKNKAMPLYVKHLKHETNFVVCRAGMALGVVGNEKAVPALIEALITSHNYQVRVPGGSQSNLSFATNGGFAGGSSLSPNIEIGLRTGQYPSGVIIMDPTATELTRTRVMTVTLDHQNAEVLSALQKLTGKNFGYDKRTWHLWWAAEKNQGIKGPLKS